MFCYAKKGRGKSTYTHPLSPTGKGIGFCRRYGKNPYLRFFPIGDVLLGKKGQGGVHCFPFPVPRSGFYRTSGAASRGFYFDLTFYQTSFYRTSSPTGTYGGLAPVRPYLRYGCVLSPYFHLRFCYAKKGRRWKRPNLRLSSVGGAGTTFYQTFGLALRFPYGDSTAVP